MVAFPSLSLAGTALRSSYLFLIFFYDGVLTNLFFHEFITTLLDNIHGNLIGLKVLIPKFEVLLYYLLVDKLLG